MSKRLETTVNTMRQQQILNQLQGGVRTWNQLRALTKISDDNLGFMIGSLLNLHKIWTAQKNDVRVYGIERRTGLVPRFPHPMQRSTD